MAEHNETGHDVQTKGLIAKVCDVAVLTVIPAEFQAIAKALGINTGVRIREDGAIFYSSQRFSELLQGNLNIIVGCTVDASESNAAAMAVRMISRFNPALIILCGIAAGIRGKTRIGDVMVPREIVDNTQKVAKGQNLLSRPQAKPWPFAIKQMMPGFILDNQKFHGRCREIFGPPIIPPENEIEEYAQHVNYQPDVITAALNSQDTLFRDADQLSGLTELHEGIRGTEMEAAGFVKACESFGSVRPWLVVRGVSDFGDTLKNDKFHSLASVSAAVWISLFLESGCDILNLRDSGDRISLEGNSGHPFTGAGFEVTTAPGTAIVNSLLLEQMERLAKSTSEDRTRELEEARDVWRSSRAVAILSALEAKRQRADWSLVSDEVKAKYLRFEASVVLSATDDLHRAKDLQLKASLLDSSDKGETLAAFIIYHEFGPEKALEFLHSPKTQDGWALRMSMLLEQARFQPVLTETDSPPLGKTITPEIRRVRSLAYLNLNDLQSAQREIGEAIAERPAWFDIRFSGAIIQYHSCFPPETLQHITKTWPVPVDPRLLKRDAQTLSALRRSEETFTQLLLVDSLDRETRVAIEGWKLACLASDVERQNEAEKFCVELLMENPTHSIAIAWAVARQYAVDLSASANALLKDLFPE